MKAILHRGPDSGDFFSDNDKKWHEKVVLENKICIAPERIDRENTISQTSEEVKRIIKYNEVAYGNYLYYWNEDKLNYIATVPLIEEYTNKTKGVLVLNFVVGKSFFNRRLF